MDYVSRVVAGFSSFDGEYSLPHVLAQGSPIFHSSFKGQLGIMVNIAVPQTPRRAGGTDCNGDCDVGGLGGRPVSATDLLRDAG